MEPDFGVAADVFGQPCVNGERVGGSAGPGERPGVGVLDLGGAGSGARGVGGEAKSARRVAIQVEKQRGDVVLANGVKRGDLEEPFGGAEEAFQVSEALEGGGERRECGKTAGAVRRGGEFEKAPGIMVEAAGEQPVG